MRKFILPQYGQEIELEGTNVENLKKSISKQYRVSSDFEIFILQSDGKEMDTSLNDFGNPFHIYSEFFKDVPVMTPPKPLAELVKLQVLESQTDAGKMMEQAKNTFKTSQLILNIAQARYLDVSFAEYSMKMKKNGLALLQNDLGYVQAGFKGLLEGLRRDTIEFEKFMDVFKLEKSKELLQSTKLLPSLQKDKKVYLIDLVDDSSLTTHYEECKKMLVPLQRQVKNYSIDLIKKETEITKIAKDASPFLNQPVEMETLLENAHGMLEAQRQIVEMVTGLVDKINSGDYGQFSQLVSLDPITKLEKNDESLRTLLISAQGLNAKYSTDIETLWKEMFAFRKEEKSFVGKLEIYSNIYSDTLEKHLKFLYSAHNLPDHYQKMIFEIERRRGTKAELEEEIENMNTVLKSVSDEENLKRKSFLETTKYLPTDICPGLNEKFPVLCVQVVQFDTKLPVIEKSEIEEGEWQHIKDEAEEKVQIFGNINLSDSQYFKRDFKDTTMDLSLTTLAKDLFKNAGPVPKPSSSSPKLIPQKTEMDLLKEKLDLVQKDLDSKVKEHETIVAELQVNLRTMMTENSSLNQQCANITDELKMMHKQKDEELDWAKKKLESEVGTFKTLTQKKEEEVENALKIANEFKKKEEANVMEIATLKKESSRLSLSLSTCQKNEQSLTETIKKVKSELELVKSTTEGAVTQLTQEKASNKNLKNENIALQQQHNDVQGKLKTVNIELEKLRSEHDSAIKKLKESTTFGISSQGTIESLKKDYSRVSNEFQQHFNVSNSKILALEQAIKDLEAKLKSANERENQLNQLNGQLAKNSQGSQDLHKALHEEQIRSQKALADERSRVVEMEKMIREMHQTELEKLKVAHDKETENIKTQIPSLLSQIKILESKLSDEKEIALRKSHLVGNGSNDNKIAQLNEIISKSTSIISQKSLEIMKLQSIFTSVAKNETDAAPLLSDLKTMSSDLVKELVQSDTVGETMVVLAKQVIELKNFIEVYISIMQPTTVIPALRILQMLKDKLYTIDSIATHMEKLARKLVNSTSVTISNFSAGDRVLFLKKDPKTWEAFNVNSPNYFLDEESVQALQEKHGNVSQAIGTILYTVKYNCQEDRTNPLKLKDSYHCVTISL